MLFLNFHQPGCHFLQAQIHSFELLGILEIFDLSANERADQTLGTRRHANKLYAHAWVISRMTLWMCDPGNSSIDTDWRCVLGEDDANNNSATDW